jgi:hypothetical protein
MRRAIDSRKIPRENWEVIKRVYDGLVEWTESGLRNVSLPQRHFNALELVMYHKAFKGRKRKDDSLRNAIGNWLCTKEFGSWRNTNREYTYKDNNKQLWQEFLDNSKEYSLTSALQEAGRFGS